MAVGGDAYTGGWKNRTFWKAQGPGSGTPMASPGVARSAARGLQLSDSSVRKGSRSRKFEKHRAGRCAAVSPGCCWGLGLSGQGVPKFTGPAAGQGPAGLRRRRLECLSRLVWLRCRVRRPLGTRTASHTQRTTACRSRRHRESETRTPRPHGAPHALPHTWGQTPGPQCPSCGPSPGPGGPAGPAGAPPHPPRPLTFLSLNSTFSPS